VVVDFHIDDIRPQAKGSRERREIVAGVSRPARSIVGRETDDHLEPVIFGSERNPT